MVHQMAQEFALWPSAMIRLGPHWCKVKWDGIVYWWVQHNTITHSETKLHGTINNNILAQLYLERSQFGAS